MHNFIIYHNPRCSKSRKTLELLHQEGVNPKIILYLQSPPDEEELLGIIKALKIKPRDLLRKGEEEFKSLNLSNSNKTDEEILSSMVKFPKLIERPIVVKGNKAIIGRPPENIHKLIKKEE